MSTYTEIPFERAEELWESGIPVEFEYMINFWRVVAPKDEICLRFWDEAYPLPSPFKYRVQTE